MIAVKDAEKLCFFSHFNKDKTVHEYVYRYLSELKKIGFAIVFISTSPIDEPDMCRLMEICSDVIVRRNRNLDWGGWIETYQKYHPITADCLLLCNDSVFGPIWPFEKFWRDLTRVEADFYGAVRSNQVKHHVQSWFMVFGKRLRESDLFKSKFLQPVPSNMKKWEIITQYEIELSHKILESKEWKTRIALDPSIFAGSSYFGNPTLEYGLEALESEILPFLKRELLRDNPLDNERVSRWREIVSQVNPKWVPLISDALQKDKERRQNTALKMLTLRIRNLFR